MTASLTLTIGGNPVTFDESTFTITRKVNERQRLQCTVLDYAGTLVFSYGEQVIATDATLGVIFSGYLIDDKENKQSAYPDPLIEHQIDTIDGRYLADKRTTSRQYTEPVNTGKVVVDVWNDVLKGEGLNAYASVREDSTLAEFAQGTLTGVSATNNVGDGDLELTAAGTPYTYNGSILFVSQAENAIAVTGYAAAGYVSPSVSWLIWTGSQSIATLDTFGYNVWVSSTSPQIIASCDFTCSDGTTLSSISIQDSQGLTNAATTDLSGLATDQWYNRAFDLSSLAGKTLTNVTVTIAGKNAGTYIAYFNNVFYTINTSSTTIPIFGTTSTLAANQLLATNGYTQLSLSQVTAVPDLLVLNSNKMYSTISIGSITGPTLIGASYIAWTQTVPAGCSILVETSIDGEATWQAATNKTSIPNLTPGMQASTLSLSVRAVCTMGVDPTQMQIGLPSISIVIHPAYQATKSDLFTSYASLAGTLSSAFNVAGTTLTNTALGAVNGELDLLGFQRNWDDGVYTDQDPWGSVASTQIVLNRQFTITCNNGEAKSRITPAGSTWQNFTMEVDFAFNSANMQCGLIWRTTGWQNNIDTYGYMCTCNTASMQFGHGTNSSTGTGAFTSLATVSLALTSNSMHRMKVVVSGTSHKIYLDDILLINATDATYTAAGYVGLRVLNSNGTVQTGTFDNFGIVSSLSGTWQSPTLAIAGPGTYGGSMVEWDVNSQPLAIAPDPTTSITVQTSVDGGSTFQAITNGGAIANLTLGQSLASKTLILKATLTANNTSLPPSLWGISVWVLGQYTSSGTRTTVPLGNDTSITRTVASGWGTAFDGQSWTQVGTATTAVGSGEATIANTTGNAFEILGTNTLTDTEDTLRFQLSASTLSAGIVLRYTDSNNYYLLSASTTLLSLIQVSSGISVTLASAPLTLALSTPYWFRFRITGSGPISLYGKVWADGAGEPGVILGILNATNPQWAVTAIE